MVDDRAIKVSTGGFNNTLNIGDDRLNSSLLHMHVSTASHASRQDYLAILNNFGHRLVAHLSSFSHAMTATMIVM